jgi:adenosylhomocysteine nucleosidase
MICFVIAMESEAKPLLSNMTDLSTKKIYDKTVCFGKLCGKDIAVVICGVGKVNAGVGAQYAIDQLDAHTIVNIGVAGGLNNSMSVGKIYCISDVVQYDFDLVQLNYTTIGTLNEFEEAYLPLKTVDLFPLKKLGTGDRFNDDIADFNLLTKTLGADIRDMEAGAIAQVCIHANVPFYSFKAISDLAGSGSTTDQFVSNLALCAKQFELQIKTIFEAING